MSESIIYANERTEKINKLRREGFVPGVLNSKGMNSKSIKLSEKEVIKLLHEHAKNAEVSVKVGDQVNHCIIKEIQREPIKGKIIHIDLQAIHDDDVIRLKVPVIFNGKEKLGIVHEILQEYVSEVEIMGKAACLPQSLTVDIGDKKYGDKITVKDIPVEDGIKILNDKKEVIAVVTAVKETAEAEEDAAAAEN